jgi:hypothetical protein
MAGVTVYGASDDLIEVEGLITEEFNPPYGSDEDSVNYLGFSDGTVIAVVYDKDGFWRITPRVVGPRSKFTVDQATNTTPNYSDIATITGNAEDFTWVVFGTDYAKAD